MNQPPLVHALSAGAYIIGVVHLMFTMGSYGFAEETLLMPIAMLSLLVLSVSVMGFLFGYRPLTMYLEGKKKEAVMFFMQTVAFFAVFVMLVVGVLFYVGTI